MEELQEPQVHGELHALLEAPKTRPVDIPNKVVEKLRLRSGFGELEDHEGDDENGEKMVPPHEILDRRLNGKMGFSVCIGRGRTLKGRDLSEVRNYVLRMTGFLESY